MPQGPKITKDVERIVAEVYTEHKNWVAKQIMQEVHRRLIKNNPKVTPDWPKLSAIQIILKKVRTNYESSQRSGLDESWTIYTLETYPHLFPPESLPFLFQSWVYTRENTTDEFTIRDAKWVARLYALYKDKSISYLVNAAKGHSFTEILNEVTGGSSNNVESNLVDMAEMYIELTEKDLTEKQYLRLIEKRSPQDSREGWGKVAESAEKKHLNPEAGNE